MEDLINHTPLPSPVGDLWLGVSGGEVTTLSWQPRPDPQEEGDRRVWSQAKGWLQRAFHSENREMTLPLPFLLNPQGTPFQHSVWQALLKIPYGETVTYGAIALALNSAPRAVGQAVGANPIPIIIPCHRVMAQNGWGGYSGLGGIETKKKLLALES
jgi:methylated-DNA-[protein]-cysteine S-methyltransferase